MIHFVESIARGILMGIVIGVPIGLLAAFVHISIDRWRNR